MCADYLVLYRKGLRIGHFTRGPFEHWTVHNYFTPGFKSIDHPLELLVNNPTKCFIQSYSGVAEHKNLLSHAIGELNSITVRLHQLVNVYLTNYIEARWTWMLLKSVKFFLSVHHSQEVLSQCDCNKWKWSLHKAQNPADVASEAQESKRN